GTSWAPRPAHARAAGGRGLRQSGSPRPGNRAAPGRRCAPRFQDRGSVGKVYRRPPGGPGTGDRDRGSDAGGGRRRRGAASGFTYWVELSGRRAVLRLPPPGARIAGPADIPRQGRIMQALHAQGLPVPGIIAMSAEPVVDGRPYVLMEALAGERIEAAAAGGSDPLELARSAIEVLQALQATLPEQSGIGSEEPVPLHAELRRWTWLMERAPAELTGDAPQLARRLETGVPHDTGPVVVHGDYHFGNMLFAGPRVSAVLDWEIAELGHPLLDLCCLCVVFQGGNEGEARGWGASQGLEPDAVRDIFG